MKYYIKLLCMLPLAAALHVNGQPGQEPYSVTRFADAKITEVRAETSGGNITLSADAGVPRVEMYVQPGNNRDGRLSREALKSRLDEYYTVSISQTNGTITAMAKPKAGVRNWRDGLSISFRIFVPAKVSSQLNTSGGNLALTGLSGTQNFRTSGGNITLQSLTGKTDGRTSGGNITMRDTRDNIKVTTSGGNISADNCSGNIEMITSGGNIDMNGLKGSIQSNTSGGSIYGDDINGDLTAHTSGGNVTLKGISGGAEASTSGGSLDIRFTDITKPVKLSNSGGDINLILPKNKGLTLSIAADNIKADLQGKFKGSQDKESIDGTLNGGGQPVRVRAGSGQVRIVLN